MGTNHVITSMDVGHPNGYKHICDDAGSTIARNDDSNASYSCIDNRLPKKNLTPNIRREECFFKDTVLKMESGRGLW